MLTNDKKGFAKNVKNINSVTALKIVKHYKTAKIHYIAKVSITK